MNLEILNRDRALSLVTGEELCDLNKKIDEFFNELFDGMIIKTFNDEPDSLFFVKSDKVEVYMEQDSKNGWLICDYGLIWSFFKDEIGLKRSDIEALIKERVEEAFNLKVETPTYYIYCSTSKGRRGI